MSSTKRAAQETGTDVIFNRGTPTKDPRPTAKGEERIQKGDKFMPKWSIPKMDEYMKGLKDGKERTILLACIKRKESKTIAKIAEEMRSGGQSYSTKTDLNLVLAWNMVRHGGRCGVG